MCLMAADGQISRYPDLQQRPDGQRWPETVLVPQSAEVADLMAWIGREIEIPGGRDDPAKALKLYTAGRAGSLDIRLVRPDVDPQGPTKIPAAADRIARIYHDTKDTRTWTPPAPARPGSPAAGRSAPARWPVRWPDRL